MKANIIFSAVIVFSIFIHHSYAQSYTCTIKGSVIDESTGKELENVDVYISGTTWGTATNKSGEFKISNLPFGIHNIVASITGYKPETLTLHLKPGTTDSVEFRLGQTSYEINGVTVSAKVPEGWSDNLDEFKKYFLGEGPFSDDCQILNPEVLSFTLTNDGDLTAVASQPLIIINNDLGYKITCNLKSFTWYNESHSYQDFSSLFFSELKDTTGELKEEWIENRKEAYAGSFADFIKSLINNTVDEKGFKIYRDNWHSLHFAQPGPEFKIRNEIDHPIIKRVDKLYYNLYFPKYIRIEYESDYRKGIQMSWLHLNFPDVLIDKFGFPAVPLSINVYGEWAYTGISNLLPRYYNPYEEDNE